MTQEPGEPGFFVPERFAAVLAALPVLEKLLGRGGPKKKVVPATAKYKQRLIFFLGFSSTLSVGECALSTSSTGLHTKKPKTCPALAVGWGWIMPTCGREPRC